jgi:hypothetical protein
VPEDLLALRVIERQELELTALLQWSLEIPECLFRCALVETCDYGALEQALADISGNVCRTGDP